MANTIEYIFSLQDKVSAKIGNIAIASDRMLNQFAGLEKKSLSVNEAFNENGRTLGALHEKIALLQAEREWIPVENIEGIRAYNLELESLNKEVARLESRSGGKFKKWSKEAFAAIPNSARLTNPLLAATDAVVYAGTSAMNFDEGMAKVNVSTQLDEKGLAGLGRRIQQVAKDNHADIAIAPAGFQKIVTQVRDTELSLQILDASMKGSRASFTDLDTVSGALVQSLSAIGKENGSAAEVLDTFFAAKRMGGSEFTELARYMPGLIAGASSMGIHFKEVAGTFAYMTGKGQSAERAAALMESAFATLGRADVRGKMEKAGISVFDDQGKMRSVVDIFTDLQGVLSGMTAGQQSSVLEQLGLADGEAKGAFTLLASDLGGLQTAMYETANASGETGKAMSLSQNSVQQATDLWNDFINIAQPLGQLILPIIIAGMDVLSIAVGALSFVVDTVVKLISWWAVELQNSNPIIWGLTAAIAALSAVLLANYIRMMALWTLTKAKLVWDGIQTGATWLLTGAQWALNSAFWACPLTWIVVAIGLVVAAVVACWKHFEGFRAVLYGCWETVKEFGRVLLDAIVTPFKQVLQGVGGVCSALLSLMKGKFKQAASEAKQGFKDIATGVATANPLAIGTKVAKNGQWSKAWDKGKSLAAGSGKASQEEQATNPMDALMPGLSGAGAPATALPGGNLDALMPSAGLPDMTISGGTRFNGVPSTGGSRQERTTERTDFLQDIMLNVRKVAAAVSVPLAVSIAASTSVSSTAYAMQDDGMQTEQAALGHPGTQQEARTIQIDRVCDQIVIHVQNTDGKGVDTIRQEIIKVFNEIYEI